VPCTWCASARVLFCICSAVHSSGTHAHTYLLACSVGTYLLAWRVVLLTPSAGSAGNLLRCASDGEGTGDVALAAVCVCVRARPGSFSPFLPTPIFSRPLFLTPSHALPPSFSSLSSLSLSPPLSCLPLVCLLHVRAHACMCACTFPNTSEREIVLCVYVCRRRLGSARARERVCASFSLALPPCINPPPPVLSHGLSLSHTLPPSHPSLLSITHPFSPFLSSLSSPSCVSLPRVRACMFTYALFERARPVCVCTSVCAQTDNKRVRKRGANRGACRAIPGSPVRARTHTHTRTHKTLNPNYITAIYTHARARANTHAHRDQH